MGTALQSKNLWERSTLEHLSINENSININVTRTVVWKYIKLVSAGS